MHCQQSTESVRIAVSFGAFTSTLMHLLTKQRAEESGTAICLSETLFSEQLRG